jgi:hypothetical protein
MSRRQNYYRDSGGFSASAISNCTPAKRTSRFGDHILRNVGTDHFQLATRRFSRDIPGPTRHIEQLDAGPSIRRGKEHIDSLTRHFADEGIVVLGLLAPTGFSRTL